MSLILEALKKSEQQRRLGEAPDLGTPIVLVRRRRSLLPLLVIAIVLATALGWWLQRKPAVPAVAPPPTAAPAPVHEPAPLPIPKVGGAVRRAPRAQTQASDGKPPDVAQPVLPMPGLPDRPGSVAVPTAMPMPEPGVAGTGAAKPHDRPAPAGPASPLEQAVKAPPPAVAAQPGSQAAAAPATKAAPAPVKTPVPAPAKAPGATSAVATAPAAVRAAAPALPQIWELPYATRKDLPALEMTMHVWSTVPAERFVVIKGERHIEGDEIADGLVLRQITPDGIELEFRGQRFMFPRDGR